MDLGIEVILELFSSDGLTKIFSSCDAKNISTSNAQRIFALKNEYIITVDSIIAFLQGKNSSLARQICSEQYLPQASRFSQLDDMEWAFGNMGLQDKAKHLATLYLEDISDFIVECIDPDFGFSRYAEKIGRSANSFDLLHEKLQSERSYIDDISLSILKQRITETNPILICFSVPFPGNLYSAFRCAQFIKTHFPEIKIAMGGGFPNTELRSVSDRRVFDYFDFISLDDGELPLEIIISNILDESPNNPNHNLYKRTFVLENNKVLYNNFSLRRDYKQHEVGTPDYSDLKLDDYISVIEIANPMHSLWSDGRWNKLTMAHGCYWGKCTFCDVSLDYIGQYEPNSAVLIVDRMEKMIAQTGENGFHFVDEAAPPALMRAVALEIIRRNLIVSWWTNIRFEKSFTWDLCRLLQASGCIAVSGGLEVASDRLLALIQKGVTVEQVAQVTRNFKESGIMVHAYLMYGYPTQTIEETIDSLEMVRQLFECGVLESAFWHQFALTAHSPIGLNPEEYKIIPSYNPISFANNDIAFEDSTGIVHDQFSYGLKKSLFNYMHGICFDYALQDWFDFKIPKTSIEPDYIINAINQETPIPMKPTSKLVWIGMPLVLKEKEKDCEVMVFSKSDDISFVLEKEKAMWLKSKLEELRPSDIKILTYSDLQRTYEVNFDDFTLFWYSDEMEILRENGLLVL